MSLGVFSSLRWFLDLITKRELEEKELEAPLEELELKLASNDVAWELAEKIVERERSALIGRRIDRVGLPLKDLLIAELKNYLLSELPTEGLDLLKEARMVIDRGDIFTIMFIGANGSGKSTTLAKFAYMYAMSGLKPLLVCADTFRAGAVEQLRAHANRLGLPLAEGIRGEDPASVSFRALEDAKRIGANVVLIDTAGRLQSDINLMNELRKIKRVVEPSHTVLVVDALLGNDAWQQASLFQERVGFDSSVVAKFDADTKGGVVLSVAYVSKRPISYIGVGQHYSDLKRFSMLEYIQKISSEL